MRFFDFLTSIAVRSMQAWIVCILAGIFVFLFSFGIHAQSTPVTVYVDTDASGANDGTSWANAYICLQDALDKANADDNAGIDYEIWVAEGVYYPDEDSKSTFKEHTNDSPGEYFRLGGYAAEDPEDLEFDNVKLYGGFAGGETAIDQRDWEENLTVLSGDIEQNDTTKAHGVVTNPADITGSNAFHVMYLNGGTNGIITDNTVIDGFIVTAGQAEGSDDNRKGGAIYCNTDHTPYQGTEEECSPVVKNVIFIGNRAETWGGAVYNNGTSGPSDPELINVTFSSNRAGARGGAMFNDGGNMGYSSPVLTNVVFVDNLSESSGGAIYNYAVDAGTTNPVLTNVVFSGNAAWKWGGAVASNGEDGGDCKPELTNSILWGNTAEDGGDQIYNYSAYPRIGYSDIQGCGGSGTGWDGDLGRDDGNNIDADPLFTNPGNGDLRLQTGSPAADAGDTSALPADSHDLDGDGNTTEPIPYDRAYQPRVIGSAVDMGAYEVPRELCPGIYLLLMDS
ncbi:MAG: choice-of-anchor Q domain-containing protein [Desulfobacterales bacterium]|nr:choice-of-anchor Q domain-containing protein [Desulfobacterales bacterium]